MTSTELCFLEKVKLIGFFSFPICYPSSGTVRGVSISSHEVSSHFLSSNGFAHYDVKITLFLGLLFTDVWVSSLIAFDWFVKLEFELNDESDNSQYTLWVT